MRSIVQRVSETQESPFRPISAEEEPRRYAEAQRVWIEEFKERNDVVQQDDGSWNSEYEVDLSGMGIESLADFPISFNEIGDFKCEDNLLRDLRGGPKKVYGWYSVANNKLVTLEGAPEVIMDDFYCGGNQLESLDGIPKEVESSLFMRGNRGRKFTEEEIRAVCKVWGGVVLN